MTEDEMVGWHHQLHGHEQIPGDGEGQRNLACCSPWDHTESDTTKPLNSGVFIFNTVLHSSLSTSIKVDTKYFSDACPFTSLNTHL